MYVRLIVLKGKCKWSSCARIVSLNLTLLRILGFVNITKCWQLHAVRKKTWQLPADFRRSSSWCRWHTHTHTHTHMLSLFLAKLRRRESLCMHAW